MGYYLCILIYNIIIIIITYIQIRGRIIEASFSKELYEFSSSRLDNITARYFPQVINHLFGFPQRLKATRFVLQHRREFVSDRCLSGEASFLSLVMFLYKLSWNSMLSKLLAAAVTAHPPIIAKLAEVRSYYIHAHALRPVCARRSCWRAGCGTTLGVASLSVSRLLTVFTPSGGLSFVVHAHHVPLLISSSAGPGALKNGQQFLRYVRTLFHALSSRTFKDKISAWDKLNLIVVKLLLKCF